MSEPMRLVYLDAKCQVRVNSFLALCILGVVYFASGSLYAALLYPDFRRITDLVVIASASLLFGGWLARHCGRGPLSSNNWPRQREVAGGRIHRTEALLLLAAFAFLGAGLVFYAAVPENYLELDKVERAGALRRYYALRIALFISPVICYLALMNYRAVRTAWSRRIYLTYLCSYALLSLIELNREMLLALGLLTLCYLARFRNWFPKFFPGQLVLVVLALVLFTVIKGLAYPILFGKEFESGLFAIGEVVNWVRWTFYVFESDIDLTPLHENDLKYLGNALVFPISLYESASAIWFREVLGEYGEGQTYGYSGLLSWYSVFGGVGVVLVPMAIGFTASILDRTTSIVSVAASFGFALVAFRFFRSEYVLVIKTFLWQYLYPALAVLFVARWRYQ